MRQAVRRRYRRALTLMELIAVVTIMGIIAALALSRFATESVEAKASTCHLNKHNIEVQTQLWFRNKGRFPATDLGNIGIDTDYFPDGLPTCPVGQAAYEIDSSTGRVVGHSH